jgi:hypothetical protein
MKSVLSAMTRALEASQSTNQRLMDRLERAEEKKVESSGGREPSMAKINVQLPRQGKGQSLTSYFLDVDRTVSTLNYNIEGCLDLIAPLLLPKFQVEWKNWRRTHPKEKFRVLTNGFTEIHDRDFELELLRDICHLTQKGTYSAFQATLSERLSEGEATFKWKLSEKFILALYKSKMDQELWRDISPHEPDTLEKLNSLALRRDRPKNTLNATTMGGGGGRGNRDGGGGRRQYSRSRGKGKSTGMSTSRGACFNWGKTGKCKFGDACRFKHVDACKNFRKGKCKKGDPCIYFHDSDLSSINSVAEEGANDGGM